jgi:chitinase
VPGFIFFCSTSSRDVEQSQLGFFTAWKNRRREMHTGKETGKGRIVMPRLFLVVMFTWIIFLTGQVTCIASNVLLQWDQNTESDLAGYKVYYKTDSSSEPFDGTGAVEGTSPIDVNSQRSATVSGLDPNKTYYFTVTAYNTSGVESTYSNIVTIPESLPPEVSIVFPANNATVNGTVSVTADASDNVGVTKVEFYVNGILQETETSAPYVYSWNTSSLADGNYTLMAKAYDAAGNFGQSENVSLKVVKDSTPPSVSLTSPGNSATVSETVAIKAGADDNIGVARVEFYANGGLISASNVAPYSCNWDTKSESNGNYILSAKAYDAAGNVGLSSNISVTVNNTVADTTAPTVTAFATPSVATSQTVSITTFTASDNIGVMGYLITESSTPPSPSASGWVSSAPSSYSAASAGSHTLYPWAKDAAGNVSAIHGSPITIVISLPDTTAPTVTAFAVPSVATSQTVSVTTFTASDSIGVTGYLITESNTPPSSNASGWVSSAPNSYSAASVGSHTLYPWAKDAAGNVSAVHGSPITIVISLPDTTAPTVTAFAIPSSSGTLTVSVTNFTATDNVAVTDYMISENATLPSNSDARWTSGHPVSYTFATAGNKTLYAWVKDAAGNVSAVVSANTTISLAEVTEPTSANVPGDIDGDGQTDVGDALLALQTSVGKVKPASNQKLRGDVAPIINGKSVPDGKVDINDAIAILALITGKIVL